MTTVTTTTNAPKVSIASVPADLPQPQKNVLCTITELTLGEANANGNRKVGLTLEYPSSIPGDTNKVFLNWFIRDEYFSPEFSELVKAGKVAENVATGYRLNFQRTTRNFFKALGFDEINFGEEVLHNLLGTQILASWKYKEDSYLKRGYRAEVTGFNKVS